MGSPDLYKGKEKVYNTMHIFLSRSLFYICSIADLPIFQLSKKPKTIYPKRNDCKEPAHNPMIELSNFRAIEFHTPSFDYSMINLPTIHHVDRPWVSRSPIKIKIHCHLI